MTKPKAPDLADEKAANLVNCWYDASPSLVPWVERCDLERTVAQALRETRELALEDAAELSETRFGKEWSVEHKNAGIQLAFAIRALKEKEPAG